MVFLIDPSISYNQNIYVCIYVHIFFDLFVIYIDLFRNKKKNRMGHTMENIILKPYIPGVYAGEVLEVEQVNIQNMTLQVREVGDKILPKSSRFKKKSILIKLTKGVKSDS